MGFMDWLRGPRIDATHQVAIQSPWAPTDPLVQFAMDEALQGALSASGMLTRESALQVPGVKRSHDILCAVAAGMPYFEMDGDARTDPQPKWLTNSQSGVSPYHRMWGITSDQYMQGWAAVGFTSDREDCLHIPYGMWGMDDRNVPRVVKGAAIPSEYTDHLVAIPLGYGSNGLLVDGAKAVRQAQFVEDAYENRITNPIALTIMTISGERYDAMGKTKRRELRESWVEGRRASSVGMIPDYVKIDTAGQIATDLYESARNASRLDLANHSGVPASLIEATRQGGGGGQDIRYSNDASQRNELYDFGASKYVRAFEARMSLDDVCDPGRSIRADLTHYMTAPSPNMNPTSED